MSTDCSHFKAAFVDSFTARPPAICPPAEQHDAQFPGEVMACISDAVCATLSAYHAAVDDPRVMKVRSGAGGHRVAEERGAAV